MAIGIVVIIISILIVAIWVIVELKRMQHKLFAIFLIALILFVYFTSLFVFKDADIDFKTFGGLTEGFKIYLSWLGSVGKNLGSITSNAIKMDWTSVNSTVK